MTRARFVLPGILVLLCAAPLAAQTGAKEILANSPKRGLCVLLGDVERSLPISVAKKSELTVYVQLAGDKQVAAARKAVEKTGMLGTRIYIAKGSPAKVYLADDLADAAFIIGNVKNSKAARKEVLRVVHPGGLAMLNGQKTVKPFSKATDEWRHPYHTPDNNPQSTDKVARGPFLTHFMAEPWYAAMPQMTVISGGRIFKVWGNRSSKQPSWKSLNTLICINAFNGTTLWRKKLKPGFLRHRSTIIATPDTLYFADDKSCQLIDPQTGKVRDEIVAPPKISDGPVWSWMALNDGVLYALVGKKEPKVETAKWRKDFRGAGWPWWRYKDYDFGFGRTILAIDPKSKRILWHHREKDYLDMRAMCMAAGKIYFYSNQKFFGCLDAKSGKLLWKEGDPKALAAVGNLSPAQNPYYGFVTTSYMKCSDKALFLAGPMCKNIVAVSAENGKYLWHIKDAGNSQLVLRKEALYALGGGRLNAPLVRGGKKSPPSYKLEPLTGKVLATFPSRDRCTRATGCVDAIFTRGGRGGSTSVFDVTSTVPKMGIVSPMRPACQDGVTVAHGHLFWGPWMCRCDFTQIGTISLGSGVNFEYGREATNAERLQAIENLTKVAPLPIGKNDWPAYRQNNRREARTSLSVSARAKRLWTYDPAGASAATAPVTASGLAFTSGKDGVVHALDAATGKSKWTAYTGGEVRFSPAVWNGRVYVGSGDGWVYCFEARTGNRLWRFRAAPTERRIPIFGSLISTWPVGGGVVVEDGVVYAAAGNANFNGTHVYALDAITGKIRWQNNNSGHQVMEGDSGAGVQGHLLLANKKIYMQGGNLTGVVSYNTADGKFERQGKRAGRYGNLSGKDLYVLGNQVQASGLPLYFRPEDGHFIEKAALPTPHGVLAVYSINPRQENPTVLVAMVDPKSNLQRPKAIWKQSPFTENNAVAIAKNAVIVAGVNRKGTGENVKTNSGICALDIKTGKTLWQHALPAQPSGWGIAIDREGRVLVSLQDGRVVCFGTRE